MFLLFNCFYRRAKQGKGLLSLRNGSKTSKKLSGSMVNPTIHEMERHVMHVRLENHVRIRVNLGAKIISTLLRERQFLISIGSVALLSAKEISFVRMYLISRVVQARKKIKHTFSQQIMVSRMCVTCFS